MKRVLANAPGLLILLTASPGFAAEVDFHRDVYPFLRQNCIACHNKTTTEAGLNMETPASMIVGGDSGPAIVPGKSDESLIIEASAHSGFIEMPPSTNKIGARELTSAELALLKRWIDEGARASTTAARPVAWQALAATVDPIYTVALTSDGRYAACGRANRIYLYDLATRQLVTQIGEAAGSDGPHRGLVNALAFSPDGTQLASGSFREVKLWKQSRTAPIDRAGDPALGLTAAVPFPDGDRIAAAAGDGALLVLEAVSGKVIRRVAGALPAKTPLLSVSADGSKVAALSSGWHLGIWDVSDGRKIVDQTTPDPSLAAKKVAAARHSAAAMATLATAEATFKMASDVMAEAVSSLERIKAEGGGSSAEATRTQIAEAEAIAAAAAANVRDAVAAKAAAGEAAAISQKAFAAAAKNLTASQSLQATALAWAADGKSLLTAGSDGLVRVWTLPDHGSTLPAPQILSAATASVTSLATGPGGKIVTGGADGKVRIFNLGDGKLETAFAVAAVEVSVSPDGKQLAVGVPDGRVLLLDAASGKPIFDLRGTAEIAARTAELQQTIDREQLEQSWQKAEAAKIAVREKALVDLLNKAKDAVTAMNGKLPEAEKAIPPLREARIAAELVVVKATTAAKNPPKDKTAAALESELQKAEVALLVAQTNENDAVAALAAYRNNITDAEEKQQKIIDTQAANKKAVADAKGAADAAKKRESAAATALAAVKKEAAAIGPMPLALAFSADSTVLAAWYEDGSLRTWSTVAGVPLETTSGPAARAGSLVYRPDGAFLVSRSDGGILSTASTPEWRLDRVLGRGPQADLFADRVSAVTFNPDGTMLATGSGEPSRSGDITVFHTATGNPTATWRDCHSDTVVSLDFSPDGKQLASGAADKIARIIDISTGAQTGLFEGHTHYVNDVAFRSDGRVLATAGADGVVNAWDLTLGERKRKIEGWTKEVTSLQFIGATDRLVTSAGDCLIRIVTDAGGQQRSISGLPDFMQAVASTSDGGMIVAGGEDSFLRVWNGHDGKEIVSFGPQ